MFWSNLFKKKDKCTIISNPNYSDIPSFDDLSKEEKEYVDKLKEEYIKFYDESINFTDLDNDLFTNIKMNQDLALDIMHKDHLGNILDSLIDSKKLVYYAHKIKEENSALKYKYIALKELRKNKKYLAKYMSLYILGKKKINILKAIDHKMNIINNLLVVTNSNIYNYNACAMISYHNINNQNVDEELDKRYKDVSKDYNDLFCKTLNINSELSVSDKITYIELLIDKFVYENKDLIDKLKEQLDVIVNSEIKDEKEQSKIIDNLMKIKMYYNIFNKYGRGKVTKEDFTDLYQIIFNVYTYFPCNSRFSEYYDSLINQDEINIYNNIIKYKIEIFVSGKSKIFEYNNFNKKELIKLINTYFFLIENDSYNISYIIKNELEMLLLMDYKNGLNMYFEKNNIVDHKHNKLSGKFDNKFADKDDYYKFILSLRKIILVKKQNFVNCPSNFLETYFSFLELWYKDKKFFELYELLNRDKINYNKIPDGLVEKDIRIFLPILFDCFNQKPIYLPKSLFKENSTLKIDLVEECFRPGIYVIPENCNNLDIGSIKNLINKGYENLFNTKLALPINKNFKINVTDDCYIVNYGDKIIYDLVQHFILKKEILDMPYKELYNYLYSLFYFLNDLIYHEHYIITNYYLYLKLFSNLKLLDENENINNIINLEDNFDAQYMNYHNPNETYKEVVKVLTNSIKNKKLKTNHY